VTWPFERPVEVKGELAKILVVADNAVVAAVAEAVQGSILLDNVPNNLALVTPQLKRMFTSIYIALNLRVHEKKIYTLYRLLSEIVTQHSF